MFSLMDHVSIFTFLFVVEIFRHEQLDGRSSQQAKVELSGGY